MIAIDTNVLVYAVDLTEPVKSQQALDLLRRLAQANSPLVVPWQVAAEFLTCLRKWEDNGRITRQDTHAYLNRFVTSLPVVTPTIHSLAIALELSERHCLSHWDSMLLGACVDAGINTLYSEDFSDGTAYGSVKVISPFSQH